MVSPGCVVGKEANGLGCWDSGIRVAAEQKAILPLFPCTVSPFMPAKRRQLSRDCRLLLHLPAHSCLASHKLLASKRPSWFFLSWWSFKIVCKHSDYHIMSSLLFSWKLIQLNPQSGNQLYLEVAQRAALSSKCLWLHSPSLINGVIIVHTQQS